MPPAFPPPPGAVLEQRPTEAAAAARWQRESRAEASGLSLGGSVGVQSPVLEGESETRQDTRGEGQRASGADCERGILLCVIVWG